MKKQRMKNVKISDISAKTLRRSAEIRRIANEAVRKAVEENRKLGIKDSYMFAK